MTVPPGWVDKVRQEGSVTLPLSSFSGDASLAYDYSRPDPGRTWAPRKGHGVILRVEPGSKAHQIADDEHVSHGDFDVLNVHDMTDDELHQEYYGNPGNHLPTTVLHVRQRSVPTPFNPHTAAVERIPKIYRGLEIEPGDDIIDAIHGSEKHPGRVGPHWSTDRSVAEEFAGPYGVVIEADHPGEDWVSKDNFWGDPTEYSYEKEVPLELNAPLNITSITH